ncbi:hypothetical protein TrVE_jg12749 [Triparma verrucosa]|uniref:Uncharacterized protein n=1 Tax=Triparma verrucosa TaxID=1606542 RepID=A0A9W7EZ29_9STRA|nr:hypothetical protein TrVE_jg12749 [Triparma verrucosa]
MSSTTTSSSSTHSPLHIQPPPSSSHHSRSRSSSTEALSRLWINPLGATPFYADNPVFSFLVQWNLTWVIAIAVAWFTRSVFVTLIVSVLVVIVVRDTRRVWVQKSSQLEVEEGRRTFQNFRQSVLTRLGESVHNLRLSRASKRYSKNLSKKSRRRALSTTEDSIEIPRPNIIPYSHGGYFGAAPFMLSDVQWISILRILQPDVFVEVARRIFAPSNYLIHWAENNPVCCAYGVLKEMKGEGGEKKESDKTQDIVIEWDVFLDPGIVSSFLQCRDPQERRHLSEALFKKMLIAHGSTPQLFIEQTGILKGYNFWRVKQAKKSLGGGMGAYDWLVLFSKALEMGCEAGKELEEKPEIQSLADALNKIKGVMGQDLKIFLDIKSRGVPGEVWAAMVEQIHTYPSIQIQGCGSFVIEEVRGINSLCGINEVFFFHSAGDLQHAIHQKNVRPGDRVFFNAGSLLWDFPNTFAKMKRATIEKLTVRTEKDLKELYKLKPYALCRSAGSTMSTNSGSTVQDYVEAFSLTVGLYVQEFSIDESAAELLINHANENQHVFSRGMAWGGIGGMTISGVQPSMLQNTDGLWAQRLCGRGWDEEKHPFQVK